MSTFIGKTPAGAALLHATAGDDSHADLTSGVQEDTLFHSSLPYITSSNSYTVGPTYTEGGGGHGTKGAIVQSFDFPAAMRNEVAAGWCFLAVARQGSYRFFVNPEKVSLFFRTSYTDQYGSIAQNYWGYITPLALNPWKQNNQASGPGGFVWSTIAGVRSIMGTISNGVTGLDNYPNLSQRYFAAGSGRWSTGGTTTNYTPFMSTSTKALVYVRSTYIELESGGRVYDGAYHGRSIGGPSAALSDITFYRLPFKNNSSGFTYTPLANQNQSEVYIDKSTIKINGTDLLSGITYLQYRGNFADGQVATPLYANSVGIASNLTTPSTSLSGRIIYASTLSDQTYAGNQTTYALPGSVAPTCSLNSSNNTVRAELYGGTLGRYWDSGSFPPPGTPDRNVAYNSINAILPQYRTSAYEFAPLPNITEVEFTDDTLTLNGNINLYSPTNQPVSCVYEEKVLTMNAINRVYSAGGVASYKEGEVTLGTTATNSYHILLALTQYPTSAPSSYCYRTGITAYTAVNSSWHNTADQAPSLLNIPNGQHVLVGSVYAEAFRNWIVSGGSGSSWSQDILLNVKITLKKNGNKLEIWSHAQGYTLASQIGQPDSRISVSTPAYKFSVLRLTGGTQ